MSGHVIEQLRFGSRSDGRIWHGCGMATWTVIDEQQACVVESGDTLALDPAVLGWQRKPEGLCRDDTCIIVPDEVTDGPIEASLLADLIGRPLALDTAERVAAFGAPAGERADALRSGIAPDFELPDLDGTRHRLSDFRGKKVVLYAYASW
jgi:hypothetical protein